MVSAKGILGAFVILVVGIALLPTVVSMSTSTAVNGTSATILALVPLFFALILLGGAVGSIGFV